MVRACTLGGSIDAPLLTRNGEIELARQVEEGERAILKALVSSPVALAELGALGDELSEGRLRGRDILRAVDEEELADGELVPRLVSILSRAGALARVFPTPKALRLNAA